MNKNERIKAAITGEKPDTIPYSFWAHMPAIDRDPPLIAEKTWEFFNRYNLDLVKTMNNGMYSVEDFGCEVDFSEIENGGVAKIKTTPINRAEDFETIKALGRKALDRELEYLSRLMEKIQNQAPVVFTVFSPLTTVNKLCNGRILEFIKAGVGKSVHKALEEITEVTKLLVEESITKGASGIFFVSQMGNYNIMTEELYREYGKTYDEEIIKASKGWCNVIHAHGEQIMYTVFKDYPGEILNYHVWESPPAIEEAMKSGKCILGGLKRMDITNRKKDAVEKQIHDTITKLNGRKLILAPGCVIRYPVYEEMLDFIYNTKESEEAKLF
ncbi:putative uroporphyrinogen decarboxylase [Treponema primitia ZAS-2]|uniref:Putative uroporphyrinogen decarboxylase n=2 Tax=Treponema primitia TaxID=88058 RepID=F5YLG2_TREPZ|nr:putative uroporphyrinogen decarboxylase [Treponema primitia ZAS-2]